MELGATVCTAKAPQCGDCPLRGECAFLAAGLPGLGERRTRPRQRFQGTDRQVRGIILNALRQAAAQAARGVADGRLETGAPGAVPRSQIEQLWPDHVQLDACIALVGRGRSAGHAARRLAAPAAVREETASDVSVTYQYGVKMAMTGGNVAVVRMPPFRLMCYGHTYTSAHR